jgi:tripartite-type tricarboxylate transporter receptor subunit TctC
MHRRSLVATAALSLAAPLGTFAQEAWPSKPIRIIVPYPAGGTTDQLARAIQPALQEFLKQTVIVENKAGAGGTIGTDQVAKAAPDGYTLDFGNTGPNAVVPLMRKIPYDPLKDLRTISTVALTPMILAVPADSPAKSLKDFLSLARQQGTAWNYGSVGNGSLSHLTGEAFNHAAGLKLTHVPYNGGAPMMTAFGGGQLQAGFVTGLDGAAMQQAGKIRYLGVATLQRTPVVNLPAIAEEVPKFQSVAWFGLLAPAGTPDPVIARLHQAVVYAVGKPEIQKMFSDRNVEAKASTPLEFEQRIKDEMQQWGEVVKRGNIRME